MYNNEQSDDKSSLISLLDILQYHSYLRISLHSCEQSDNNVSSVDLSNKFLPKLESWFSCDTNPSIVCQETYYTPSMSLVQSTGIAYFDRYTLPSLQVILKIRNEQINGLNIKYPRRKWM